MTSFKGFKEKLNKKLLSKIIMGSISMLSLFGGFYSNSFNTVKNESDWDHIRKVTDFMVISKLAISESEGIFYKGGLSGIIESHPKNSVAFDYPYQAY